LSRYIFLQSSLLFSTDRFQRPIVKSRVKRQTRGVQLLYDGDIQLLLRDQDFDIAPPHGSGQTRVEQGLDQGAAYYAKAFYSAFTGAVAGLNARRYAQFNVRPGDGTKDQPLSRSLFQA
jgi:hypothetical protein